MNHAQRYALLANQTFPNQDFGDYSYKAAFYLLSYDPELFDAARKYVTREGIDFTQIKRVTKGYDTTTRDVIDIAHNLFKWTSPCKANPHDMACLGYPYLELVTNAIYISAEQANIIFLEDKRNPDNVILEVDFSRWEKTKEFARNMNFMMEP